MPTFTPDQLAQWTGGAWTAAPSAPLSGFHFDTRRLAAGGLFVALRTEKRDGHDFLGAARAAGAGAALVARADHGCDLPQLVVPDPLAAFQAIAQAHRRTFPRPVIGISGSAGKTSTKDLLALLLGGVASGVVATEGNLNNHLGVPMTLTRIDPARHTFAVVEAGIGAPGEMASLAAMIEPDLALITLVAPAHTEALGGLEGVAREKALLPAATRPGGVAIFPSGTAEFGPFRELDVPRLVIERAEVVRPADPPEDRVYFAVSHRGDRTAVSIVHGPPQPQTFVLPRVSDGMAQNAVLAICAARWLGIPAELIRARLLEWMPPRLRGEVRELDGRYLYLDCYNANPASMADALAAFDSTAPADQPRLYLLGCMEELGAEAAAYHHTLGRSLRLRSNDRVLVIGTHAADVCAGVLEQGDFSRQIQMASTLAPMADALAGWRGAVFVKGSRRYQLEKILEQPTPSPLPC